MTVVVTKDMRSPEALADMRRPGKVHTIVEPLFAEVENLADRLALFESLLREAEVYCPKSLDAGSSELANRIERALMKEGAE